ncbi:uncharacterized protein EDB91DRAFT_1253510 [Suillus paluster]|uniref:uncharacterized protein n=1 Tax=Suillus paluster TaxID=48578 RepID=UPI001B881A5E|nr:uncharacterized protein EDB91DRAFT_1253510 [Suillus paluster]KAG1728247.1 hypothetical protein EDB91DRAFT_1253510 [Suillus paluster]
MSNSTTLFTYELNDFTAWDAANVLEYATLRFAAIWLVCDRSHVPRTPAYKASFVRHLQWEADCFAFPYINLCLVMNIHPTMPDLLRLVIAHFAHFQTGTINAEELHDKFFECCSPNDQELWSNHRVVRNYSHDWWKDRFDRLGFELLMLTIQEPIGAMLMPGPAVTGQVDSDALFNQIVAVRAHLRHLGEAMASLLEQKTQIAAAAASTISQLEAPIDEVEQALINSRRRFCAEQ